ncbi:hypothetical protein AB0H57_10750 [Micromonospora sp. NPDC050686]|uniref:hypothetical protein n=1 Tax=Micromonospora sp. NPDC050686 TaxID=3154631 RepID=UPI0033C41516
MSYPVSAPARRPAGVTFAAVALVLMAAGALLSALAGLLAMAGTVDRFRAAAGTTTAGQDQVDAVVTLIRAAAVLSAVVTVLAGVLLVGLALGLLAGRPGARIATWVVCGLGLLCGCGALALLVGQRAAPLRLGGEQASGELLGTVADAYPSWWLPLNGGLSAGQALGYLVVAALLATPAVNAWFGAHRPAPVPPVAPGPPPYPPR